MTAKSKRDRFRGKYNNVSGNINRCILLPRFCPSECKIQPGVYYTRAARQRGWPNDVMPSVESTSRYNVHNRVTSWIWFYFWQPLNFLGKKKWKPNGIFGIAFHALLHFNWFGGKYTRAQSGFLLFRSKRIYGIKTFPCNLRRHLAIVSADGTDGCVAIRGKFGGAK